MIFFTVNGHYYFIKALVDSFTLIPPFGVHLNGEIFNFIMRMASNLFTIAVKVGAPVMVALLLTQTALALAARTVPQMQIFIVAMPLQILLGLIFLGISLPFCMVFLENGFKQLGVNIVGLIGQFR